MEVVVSGEKPLWLRIRPPCVEPFAELKGLVDESGVATVCQESHCPNMSECWSSRTLTFMVMGDSCTRGCRFCNVRSCGKGEVLDVEEPRRLAISLQKLGLKYAVITTVCRDDLVDQGAGHLANCVSLVKELNPELVVEVLAQDFRGDLGLVRRVGGLVDVFGHNLETVKRLQSKVRDRRAGYEQSLSVLREVARVFPGVVVKSGLMVGLGESEKEVVEVFRDLVSVGVSIVSVGQYLRPRKGLLDVVEYVRPEQFKRYEVLGREAGLKVVVSGPFVRSSYRAYEAYMHCVSRDSKKRV